MRRDGLLSTLRGLLGDVMRARFEAVPYHRLARAHGFADGYMRALLDAGIVDRRDLRTVVREERRRFVAERDAAA